MRSVQVPAAVHVGEVIRTNPSGSSTVNIHPSLVAAPLYQSSTSSVRFTVTSPAVFIFAMAVGLVTRSLPPDLPPGVAHSTFFGRVERFGDDPPAPPGAITRRI